MSDRATGLAETADRQITDLANLLATTNEEVLRSACPGREKLGDGTIAAVARHTADTYHRIASFVRGDNARGDPPHQRHDRGPTETSDDLGALAERLAAARHAANAIADLTDKELNTIPPAGAARFCDGQRTLEQVLTRMLNHQRHQVDAMKSRHQVAARTHRAHPLSRVPTRLQRHSKTKASARQSRHRPALCWSGRQPAVSRDSPFPGNH